jgi:hypothetical protein
MNTTETERHQGPAKLRWYQYRLRTLLLLFPLVAMVTASWASCERLHFDEYPDGDDMVISTSRFEIVGKGVACNSVAGSYHVGGLGWEEGGYDACVNGVAAPVESHKYAWGTLTFEINGARFSFRRHAREVVANGRCYRIQNRAVITIDEQGKITVEDRPPP